MDATAFDISAVPDNQLSTAPGVIEILGEHHSIDQLACEANTISYELLTQLGNRFQRVYK